MKIGFSLGKCVRDLVNKTVDYNDVLLIISATLLENRAHLEQLVEEYGNRNNYWRGLDTSACMAMAYRIWDDKKLIQPRLYNAQRSLVPSDCVWADVCPAPVAGNEAVRRAWDQYRMLVDLTAPSASDSADWKEY